MSILRAALFPLAAVAGVRAGADDAILRVNEVMAKNGTTLLTADGDAADWFELYNPAETNLDISGWWVCDDATKKWSKWQQLPEDVVVPAGGYLVVWADGYTGWTNGEVHVDLGFSDSGESVVIANADSNIVAKLDFPTQLKDVSYGYGKHWTELVPAGSSGDISIGGSDTWTSAAAPVGFSSTVGSFTCTQYNMTDPMDNVDIAESFLATPSKWRDAPSTASYQTIAFSEGSTMTYSAAAVPFPGNTTTGQQRDHYAVVCTGSIVVPSAGLWTFAVGGDDGYRCTISGHGTSFSLERPGTGGYTVTTGSFNFPAAGAYDVRLVFFEYTGGAAVDFAAAQGDLDFDASLFHLVGTAESGLVHAPVFASALATDVSATMGSATRLDVRIPFELAELPVAGASLELRLRYKDGFVAMLNGTEIARANAPAGTLAETATATASRTCTEALQTASFAVPVSALVQGANTLVVSGLAAEGATDFLVDPSLVLVDADDAIVYFPTPTPGAENSPVSREPMTPEITFSEPHGYKTAAFQLELSCADAPDADIYYTLDGTSPSASNGTLYTAPIAIASTTVVRAAVPNPNSILQVDSAASYLFLDDVLAQGSAAPAGFPADRAVNNQAMRYAMDQSIVTGADAARLLNGFTNSICTLSIVCDPGNLFNAQTGIYVNAYNDGRAWERMVHVEQIDPVHGADNEFSAPAGLRIRGAASRDAGHPKHSFRLFFRAEYGLGSLAFPLFGDEGADEFDKVDLRTSQNHSWANENSGNETFVHEVFSRDSQRDMGEPYTRSRFYHLYLNGVYWGLFQTQERADKDFAETYMGGSDDNWDVIKTDSGRSLTANDGTINAYNDFWTLAVQQGFAGEYADNYRRALGLNPDGTRNPEYPVYLNPTNLAVYTIVSHYTCDGDAPTSAWGGFVNNLYALRDRVDGDAKKRCQGFLYFHHDAEHTLGADPYSGYVGVAIDPTLYGTEAYGAQYANQNNFNPAELHYKLMANPEYRLLFADLVQKHCFGEGAMTPAKARARFESRMAEIDDAVVCESARWGNGKTRANWLARCNTVLDGFIDRRLDYLLPFYRARGWFPELAAPVPSAYSGTLVEGEGIGLTCTNLFYYTVDGSDPRAEDGTVATGALAATGSGDAFSATALASTNGLHVMARAYSAASGEWSALQDVAFDGAEGVSAVQAYLRVAEIMSSTADGAGDGSEYIVLTNLSANSAFDLGGVRITCAKSGKDPSLDLTLPAGLAMPAGGTLTLDKAAYWPDAKITNGKVDAALYDGETLVQTLYIDASWWNKAADGTGAAFIALDFGDTVTDVSQWRPTFTTTSSVRIREVMSAPAANGSEYLVLTNLSDTVTAKLADLSIAVGAPGAEPSFTVSFASDATLAPGATLTLDAATYWPGASIPDAAADIALVDTALAATNQFAHLEGAWYFGRANGQGDSFFAREFGDAVTAEAQWGTTLTFAGSAYDVGALFQPGTPNLLLGKTPSISGGTVGSGNEGSGGVALLTDGAVNGTAYANICLVHSGATMAFDFGDWPLGYTLDEIRIYAMWGDNGRDRIHYDSIEVQALDGTWSTLTAYCPNEHLGQWNEAGYNNAVSRPRIAITRGDGSPLADGVKGLRIHFGTQENGYVGYTEIEAVGEAVTALAPVGRIDAIGGISFSNATFSVSVPYAGVGDGAALSLTLTPDRASRPVAATNVTGVATGDAFDIVFDDLRNDTRYAYSLVLVDGEGTASDPVTGSFETLSLSCLAERATGGDEIHHTTGYVAHQFFSDGIFHVEEPVEVDVLVVGGGGGGGMTMGGGGGGGGVATMQRLALDPGDYAVTVGAGGLGATSEDVPGANGGASSFAAYLSALGGGGGGSWASKPGQSGATGGGSVCQTTYRAPGVAGQGRSGGAAYQNRSGGGGGAGAPGEDGHQDEAVAGSGGDGVFCDYTGASACYGGGGGGGAGHTTWTANGICAEVPGQGGQGGGAAGSVLASGLPGGNGADGLGGGGGGGGYGTDKGPATAGGNGGSGTVVIRYANALADFDAPVLDEIAPFAFDESTATATLRLLGAGGATLYWTFGRDAENLPEATAHGPYSAGESFEVGLAGLRPGTDYLLQIYAEDPGGVRSETIAHAFTTLPEPTTDVPGLKQVRFSSGGGMDKTSGVDSANALDPHRTLGTVMAFTFADPSRNATYINEVDGDTLAWADNTTFLYAGYIFLTNGLVYAFGANVDDHTYLVVDGQVLIDYSKNGFSAGTFRPTRTGWHSFECRLYNGGGGAGGNTGIGDFKLGAAYNTVGDTAANSQAWTRLKDPGDGSLFTPELVVENPVTVVSASRSGTTLNAVVRIDVPDPADLYAAYGATYGGVDLAAWDATTESFGATDGTAPVTHLVSVPVGDDGVYVRFYAVSRVDGHVWFADTLLFEDVEVEGGAPSLLVGEPTAVAYESATLPVSLVSLGAGAESCDLYAVYGATADHLSTTNLLVEGATIGDVAATPTGLLPGRQYFVRVLARNDLGVETLSDAVTVRTTELDESGDKLVGIGEPGLWQAVFQGGDKPRQDAIRTAANAEVIPEGVLAALISDTGRTAASSFTGPSGRTYSFSGGNRTFAYEGYMFLEAGNTYTFGKCFDDGIRVKVGGETVIDDGTWNAAVYGAYTPASTGWYPIDIRFWDGSGNWGVGTGNAFSTPFLGAGLAYSAAETSLTADNWTNWLAPTNLAGKVVFRTEPLFRTLDVASYAVDGEGRLAATLAFGSGDSDGTARPLYVAYGAHYAGTDTNAWEHVVALGDVAADTMGLVDTTVGGIRTDVHFVRYFLDFGPAFGQTWTDTLVFGFGGAPELGAAVTVGATGQGDGFTLAGTLVATGGSDCAVVAEVSADPDLADASVWPVGVLTEPGAVQVAIYTADTTSPAYIQPGTTYYYRLKAENESGEIDATAIGSITTPASAAVTATGASSAMWTATFTGTLDTFGAGDTTTVWLCTGASADALEPNGEPQVFTDTGDFTFSATFPSLYETVYYAFLVSNACSTASWTAWSNAGSIQLVDQAVYTWKADVAAGAWNDAANWISEPDDPRLGYPDDPNCTARFALRGGSGTTVTLSDLYEVGTLDFASGEDVTFTGADADTTRVTANRFSLGTGVHLTVDGTSLFNATVWDVPTGFRGLICNEGVLYVNHSSWESVHFSSGDTRMEVRGGSTLSTAGHISMDKADVRIVIDDSLVDCGYYFVPARGAEAVSNVVEFVGTTPKLRIAGACTSNWDNKTPRHAVTFLYHVPKDGYAEAPLQQNGAREAKVFARENNKGEKVRIEIAEDSEIFRSGRHELVTKLIDWPKKGIGSELVDLADQPRASQTSLFYKWGDALTGDGDPTSLWTTLEGRGATVIYIQ